MALVLFRECHVDETGAHLSDLGDPITREVSVIGNEPTLTVRSASGGQQAEPAGLELLSQQSQRQKVVPLWSLLALALIACIASGATSAMLVAQRNTQHRHLVATRTLLAGTTSDRDTARKNASDLQTQVSGLQTQLSETRGQLANANELSAEFAAVTDSLKSCGDLTTAFVQEFENDIGNGSFDPSLDGAAQSAHAACSQANSDYEGLLSELRSAGVHTQGSSISATPAQVVNMRRSVQTS